MPATRIFERGLWSPLLAALALLVGPAAALAEPPAEPSMWAGSPWTSIWALVIFLLLLAVLGKYAWKPVVKTLEERELRVAETIDHANRTRDEAMKLLELYKKQLQHAQADSQRLLQKTQAEADRLRQEILDQARSEADNARVRALEQIEAGKDHAVASLFARAADLAAEAASEILHREIKPDEHRQLVEAALAEMENRGAAKGQP